MTSGKICSFFIYIQGQKVFKYIMLKFMTLCYNVQVDNIFSLLQQCIYAGKFELTSIDITIFVICIGFAD